MLHLPLLLPLLLTQLLCSAYESFNAAVGLLGLYNDAIIAEHPGQQKDVANWAFWLAAVEQVGWCARVKGALVCLCVCW